MKSLLRLLPFLARYKRTLLLGLLTVVLSNLFTVAMPMFVGRAIDVLKHGLEYGVLDTGGILGLAGAVVGFSLVAGFFTFLTRQTIIVVSRHVEFDLRNAFLQHLQRLSLGYFQRTPTGDLMAHATNDKTRAHRYPSRAMPLRGVAAVIMAPLVPPVSLAVVTPYASSVPFSESVNGMRI